MPADRPFLFNSGANRMREDQLDQAAIERYAPSNRALSFDIDMNASPSSHPGGYVTFSGDQGLYIRYTRNLNQVTLWFTIPMTNATFVGGFGPFAWAMRLPEEVSNLDATTGQTMCRGGWSATDASTGFMATGWCELAKSSSGGFNPNAGPCYALFYYLPLGVPAVPTTIKNNAPWTWAVADSLTGFMLYEASDFFTP